MTQETTNHTSARQSSHCSLIIALVAKEHGLTPAQLLAEDRTPAVSRPRQMAMLLARELTGASYPDLARAFQRKDHNTIMHGCGIIKVRIACEKDFNRAYRNAKRRTRRFIAKHATPTPTSHATASK